MAKQAFKEHEFNTLSRRLIGHVNGVIDDFFSTLGLRLTLRQIFYQLVTQNIVRNQEKSYKSLGHLISEARLAGLIDWDAIEDRVRRPEMSEEFTGIPDLLKKAEEKFRLPRWEGQKNYVELWVEKDALAGVLAPLAEEFHVVEMVNRGYSSQTAMYEAARRFARQITRDGLKKPQRTAYCLYVGDFDPSGEDMVRDIHERFEMFGVPVVIEKLALTTAQITLHSPPPNPAKISDPRAAKYMAEHGEESWEVDALRPDVLQEIIRKRITQLVNKRQMDAMIKREENEKRRFHKAIKPYLLRESKRVSYRLVKSNA